MINPFVRTVVCVGTLMLVSAEPAIKNSKAREAAALYEKQVERAEQDCHDRILRAQRAYRDALVQAQGQAVRAGDLDDANAIRETIRELDEHVRVEGGGLTIAEARWGVNGKWSDFTRAAQARVIGDALAGLGNVPDPAVGQFKSIVIRGTYGGKPFVFVCDTGNPLKEFYLGRPPQGGTPK